MTLDRKTPSVPRNISSNRWTDGQINRGGGPQKTLTDLGVSGNGTQFGPRGPNTQICVLQPPGMKSMVGMVLSFHIRSGPSRGGHGTLLGPFIRGVGRGCGVRKYDAVTRNACSRGPLQTALERQLWVTH